MTYNLPQICEYCSILYTPVKRKGQKYCRASCRSMACKHRRNGNSASPLSARTKSAGDLAEEMKFQNLVLTKTRDQIFEFALEHSKRIGEVLVATKEGQIDIAKLAKEFREFKNEYKKTAWVSSIAGPAVVDIVELFIAKMSGKEGKGSKLTDEDFNKFMDFVKTFLKKDE